MEGDVLVIGTDSHLQVWNRKLFEDRILSQEFTQQDFEALDQFGI